MSCLNVSAWMLLLFFVKCVVSFQLVNTFLYSILCNIIMLQWIVETLYMLFIVAPQLITIHEACVLLKSITSDMCIIMGVYAQRGSTLDNHNMIYMYVSQNRFSKTYTIDFLLIYVVMICMKNVPIDGFYCRLFNISSLLTHFCTQYFAI